MAKIAYIGKFRKIYDEEQIARGFESLGHKVARIEEESLGIIDAPIILRECNPDLVLFAKLCIIGNPQKVLDIIKDLGLKTASWTFDIYWDSVRQPLIKIMPQFKADYVFTTDGGNDEDWERAGINHYTVRQGIYEGFAYMAEVEPKYDIVFVGGEATLGDYRLKLMSFLEETYGDKFHWFGRYNTNEVREHALNELYASAKIIIGDSVYSPHYWSNRIYETIGRGGFFIHPMVEGLDREFEPYKEFIPYNYGDFNGLKTIIDYYLTYDEERNAIRRRGFERCKDYTYAKRCAVISKILFDGKD
jgi:hypothetical protein